MKSILYACRFPCYYARTNSSLAITQIDLKVPTDSSPGFPCCRKTRLLDHAISKIG